MDTEAPHVVFRESTTKSDKQRRVDVRAELAELLRAARDPNALPTDRVLQGRLADYDLFRKHLARAGISGKDRVIQLTLANFDARLAG